MRTALGCPEALGQLGSCPMYRDGGRGAAASRFLRRVWCTLKALMNGYVNQGVKRWRSAALGVVDPHASRAGDVRKGGTPYLDVSDRLYRYGALVHLGF